LYPYKECLSFCILAKKLSFTFIAWIRLSHFSLAPALRISCLFWLFHICSVLFAHFIVYIFYCKLCEK
jgi:hypothetical protein